MYCDDPRIIERAEAPAHRGRLADFTHTASGDNPFCGDSLQLFFKVNDQHGGFIEQASFDGYACSLCLASSDLLLDQVIGMPVAQAHSLGLDSLLLLWGGLEVGRARRGCVELSLRILGRALTA
ncbi:MAG: iron-sulfur cluster assembly scaffold protein [Eggerthellaceae bacterium]|nr:iron-sulfur cluster assembly scaffold protein [Eggerthellaceae bacterium]